MNSININTSQNVTINYEMSGVGERIVAGLIDLLIKIGYILLAFYLMDKADVFEYRTTIMIILLLPVFLYSLLFELFMQGQTPGKKLRKIRVVKIDGGQPNFGAYLVRWLFRLVDINMFSPTVAIVTVVISEKGQRWGDILAETTVIVVRDRVSLKDTLYEKVNDNYSVSFPEAKKLSTDEVQIIKQVLNTKQYRDNFDMVYKLTNKIQTKMGVIRVQAPEAFLETVVKDYNFMYDE